MKIRRTKEKGFTTLEMIVTVLIATITLGAITSFMTAMTKSYRVTQDIADLQYQAQVTMNKIVDEIMYAKEIKALYEDGSGICLLSSNEDKQFYTYIKVDSNSKLYYLRTEVEQNSKPGYLSEENLEAELYSEENLLAKDVSLLEFIPNVAISTTEDAPKLEDASAVEVKLGFSNKSKSTYLTNEVKIRNK